MAPDCPDPWNTTTTGTGSVGAAATAAGVYTRYSRGYPSTMRLRHTAPAGNVAPTASGVHGWAAPRGGPPKSKGPAAVVEGVVVAVVIVVVVIVARDDPDVTVVVVGELSSTGRTAHPAATTLAMTIDEMKSFVRMQHRVGNVYDGAAGDS